MWCDDVRVMLCVGVQSTEQLNYDAKALPPPLMSAYDPNAAAANVAPAYPPPTAAPAPQPYTLSDPQQPPQHVPPPLHTQPTYELTAAPLPVPGAASGGYQLAPLPAAGAPLSPAGNQPQSPVGVALSPVQTPPAGTMNARDALRYVHVDTGLPRDEKGMPIGHAARPQNQPIPGHTNCSVCNPAHRYEPSLALSPPDPLPIDHMILNDWCGDVVVVVWWCLGSQRIM